MKTRLLAVLIMLPAALAAIFLLSTPWLAALTALILLGALREWYVLLDVRGLECTALLVLNLLLMALLVWASKGSLALFHLSVLIGAVFWLLVPLWLRRARFGADGERLARMLKLLAASLAVIPAWAALVVLHTAGPLWLLTALAITWGADSGAYFTGRAWGKRKLAPYISPNKTVEGVYGGLVVGVLAGLGFGGWAGTAAGDLGGLALAALATVLAAVLGDLFESLIKRHAGAKDSSQLIPGHGGLLDRLDAIFAALPVFALGKNILGL